MSTISTTNGSFVSNQPLTTQVANTETPDLLQNSVDERIVKIRPMATPLDQISRCAATRHCDAMRVDYYAIDTKPVSSKVSEAITSRNYNLGDSPISIKVQTPRIFESSDTAMFPSVLDSAGNPLVIYVTKRTDNGIKAIPLLDNTNVVPAIPADAEIVRMGRAATETDVQTPQFEALPKKKFNYCQIFKMQVEQTTFMKLANKEVGWNFSDQEEVAVIDMRQGMEKSFLFGSRMIITDPDKGEDVMLTGGIWGQTSNKFEYLPSSLTEADLIDLCKKAFTGHSGSKRKILIAGTELVNALSKIQYNKVVTAGETTVRWGLEFHEIRSNFGTIFLVHSETFDECGHAADGMIIDPDYLTKYVHVPFRVETLDLRTSGQRNTDAVVITEASCLVLRHPDAHIRVVATNL